MNLQKELSSLFIISTGILFSCTKPGKDPSTVYTFDFNSGLQGWSIIFSDYPVGEENNYELVFEHTELPVPLDNSIKSIKVSGNNHSDDLLSMLYRKFGGLKPNTKYEVGFSVSFASNACKTCPGAGGSPDLCLGAGTLPYLPKNNIQSDPIKPMYRPNFESLVQSCSENNTFKVLGKIGVGDGNNIPYKLISLNNYNKLIQVTTNSNGELWVLIGIDSGYEGITTLYYKSITVDVAELK